MTEKECFGVKCQTCKEFFQCEEHWGPMEDEDDTDDMYK